MPEDDWVTSGWDLVVVDVVLAVTLPLVRAVYPPTAEEAELGVAVRSLEEGCVAAEYVPPSERVADAKVTEIVLALVVISPAEGVPHLSMFTSQPGAGQTPFTGRSTSW